MAYKQPKEGAYIANAKSQSFEPFSLNKTNTVDTVATDNTERQDWANIEFTKSEKLNSITNEQLVNNTNNTPLAQAFDQPIPTQQVAAEKKIKAKELRQKEYAKNNKKSCCIVS